MPLTLHHGPASLEKQAALNQIVSTQSTVSILSSMDWNNFLQKLASSQFTVHSSKLIDTNTALVILASITPKATKALLNLFVQLKSCGIGVAASQKIFPDQNELPVIQIFDAYEKALAERGLFDEGSLTLNMIHLLRNGKIKLDKQFKNIIIAGLYPLHIGQREILRLLTQKFPQINIDVFYDESFDQSHESLDRAYLDLGQMAHVTKHYDVLIHEHTIHECKTPIHETRFVVAEIKKRISEGLKPENIAIVLLDTKERLPIERALLTTDIPYTLDMELSMVEVLPSYTGPSPSRGEGAQRADGGVPSDATNVFLQRKNYAQQLIQKLMGEYIDSPLQFIFSQLTFYPPLAPNAVVVTTLDRALVNKNKHIFLMGLSLEHLTVETEEIYGVRTLATRNELTELLKTPAYRMHVASGLLGQLLGSSKDVFLTRAEMDRASRPLMRVGGQQFCYKLSTVALPTPQYKSYKTYKPYKTYSFSVSALQEYLDCPYSFYAKYVLKAEPFKKPQLEPDGKTRGAFVHDVLKRLFHTYGSLLVQSEAQKAIGERLQTFIDREASTNSDLKIFPPAVIKEFTDRVSQTLSALITRESQEISENIKQTIPKFCEWDFGRSNERRFEIPTPQGPLSITGRIDRIDMNEEKQQFSVVDFKTGLLPTLDEILSGQALQLTLYVMAVQKILYPNGTPSAALYYGLKTDRVFGFTLKGSCDEKILRKANTIDPSTWQEVQKQTSVHIVHIVHQVHRGQFDPKPYDTKKCEFCDFKRICGFKK